MTFILDDLVKEGFNVSLKKDYVNIPYNDIVLFGLLYNINISIPIDHQLSNVVDINDLIYLTREKEYCVIKSLNKLDNKIQIQASQFKLLEVK